MSVFGALNRFISRLDDAPRPQSSSDRESSYGFQVLRNTRSDVPLEPWFDFIVGINGRPIDNPDPTLFANEIRNCAGSSATVTVWSAKGQRTRAFYLPISSPPHLGLSLQWTRLSLTSHTWHILEVAPNSPADVAGLLAYSDYIIGSPEGELIGETGLGELVEEFLNRPMRLFVYNHEYNVSRTLTLTPVRGWGGEGALGCVLGYGHLHQLPMPLEEGPPTAAGETMFEGQPGRVTPEPAGHSEELEGFAMSPAKADGNFVTPSEIVQTLAPTGGPGGRRGGKEGGTETSKRGRRARPTGPTKGGFEEMFAEGEQRSKETDNAPKARTAELPPPPKIRSSAVED